ncbi:MAG: hypothetical protein JNL09_10850, partial [Anaerolineales bacterium]|nr:hypothetical protein [Anaerolineales bacterium]
MPEQKGNSAVGFFSGLAIVVALGIVAWWLNGRIAPLTLPLGIPGRALEYPLWAALVGLAGNFILKTLKLY